MPLVILDSYIALYVFWPVLPMEPTGWRSESTPGPEKEDVMRVPPVAVQVTENVSVSTSSELEITTVTVYYSVVGIRMYNMV